MPTFEKNTLKKAFEWLLLVFSHCYSNTELTVKKTFNCFLVSIFYLPVILIPYKTQQRLTVILNDTYSLKSQNFMCWIYWQNWKYVGHWLSVHYRTSPKINLSNLERETFTSWTPNMRTELNFKWVFSNAVILILKFILLQRPKLPKTME